MKVIALASALALAVVSSPAFANDEVLTIENRTGYTISEIYLAAASSDNWEEDVMGADALETDDQVNIDMSRSDETCKWDLRAVYDDETTAVWRNIDLCRISTITLFYNDKTDVTSARYR